MPAPAIEEHHIPTPAGHVFAQVWRPPQPASPLAPIILLHESLGCTAMWRAFPAALCTASGRAVVGYDRLGFGRSSARSDSLPPNFIAYEAQHSFAAVRAHLGLTRFALFGHSVGGGMAVHCAAQYPNACVAVVTEAAQAFVEDRTVQGIEAARAAFAQPQQRERLAKYHDSKTDWVLTAWIDTWLHPDFAHWQLDAATLAQVQAPLLALHGQEDEYGSLEHARRITAGVGPHAHCHPLPGVRHIPHLEVMDVVVAQVSEFLRLHATG